MSLSLLNFSQISTIKSSSSQFKIEKQENDLNKKQSLRFFTVIIAFMWRWRDTSVTIAVFREPSGSGHATET